MPLVPMFVAGTANGPIADQRLTNGLLSTSSSEPGSIDTGLATMRPYLWGHLGTGIGPAFRDEKELWERLIAEYQAGRTDERLKQYFWLARRIEPQWAFKKRPLLGTNEHREMGVQSTIEDTLAWAAFGIVVETWLRCMYRLGKTPFPYMEARPSNRYTASIDDDITRAAHGGLEAIILNPFSADAGDRMTEAANVVRHLVEQVQPVTEALDLQDEMARILWICEGNAGYHWQRLAFQNGGIDAVLRHLINAMND